MKTVFVTGASGLMGVELCDALLAKGFEVIGVDNTPNTNIDKPNYTFVQAAIDDKDAVTQAMSRGIDVLIHLACTVDNDFPNDLTPAEEKKSAFVDKYLYKAAINAGVNDMILISTHQVYAPAKTREPIRETMGEKPVTIYGKLKFDSEKALSKAVKSTASAKGRREKIGFC